VRYLRWSLPGFGSPRCGENGGHVSVRDDVGLLCVTFCPGGSFVGLNCIGCACSFPSVKTMARPPQRVCDYALPLLGMMRGVRMKGGDGISLSQCFLWSLTGVEGRVFFWS